MLLFQHKMAPYPSLFISVALFLVELRWSVAYFLFFSVFLFLYFPNLWKKQFPLSVFVFIDSLVVSASKDAGGYAISRQNNIELHLGWYTC